MLNWQTSSEANKLRQELDEKESEINRLQLELRRRENEGTNNADSMRRIIAGVEKENAELKVDHLFLCIVCKTYRH